MKIRINVEIIIEKNRFRYIQKVYGQFCVGNKRIEMIQRFVWGIEGMIMMLNEIEDKQEIVQKSRIDFYIYICFFMDCLI